MGIMDQVKSFKGVREDIKKIRNELTETVKTLNTVEEDEHLYEVLLVTIKQIIAHNSAITTIGNSLSWTDSAKLVLNPEHAVGLPLRDALKALETTITQFNPDDVIVCGEKSALAATALANVFDINLRLNPGNITLETKRETLLEKAQSYSNRSSLAL